MTLMPLPFAFAKELRKQGKVNEADRCDTMADRLALAAKNLAVERTMI
jgi:hypothetical protein